MNPDSAALPPPGKYLTFTLGRDAYGIPVGKVREILRMPEEVTPVPQTPPYVRGVINLRGKIIPVVDLRVRFGLGPLENRGRVCAVVVQVVHGEGEEALMGLIVDAVEEVLPFGPADLGAVPQFGTPLQADYLLGMAQAKGRVMTLLNIDRIGTADALAVLAVS